MPIPFLGRTLGTSIGFVATVIAFSHGCNSHPIQPFERIVTAANVQLNQLPAKTKIDFLFVIDNSQSMCQEQINLAENFKAFSNFLYDELRGSADYHIAVTSTDMNALIGNGGLPQGDLGRFLTGADPSEPSVGCKIKGETFRPNIEGCGALIQGRPILKASEVRDKLDLEAKFNCLSTLGVTGDPNEAGLEAMRVALSCNGPNRAYFGGCCVPADPTASPTDPTTQMVFNPACDPKLENFPPNLMPQFLRPDALLVVIFVSDENDCSYPALNTQASTLAICNAYSAFPNSAGQMQYTALPDINGDQLPDSFSDLTRCQGMDPRSCYVAECQNMAPDDCFASRCVVDVGPELAACAWQEDRLTPIGEYYDFLSSLKGQPLEKLVVATIVGQKRFTPSGGQELFYVKAQPQQIAPMCQASFGQGVAGGWQAPCTNNEECMSGTCSSLGECLKPPLPLNLDVLNGDMCCPNGACQGTPQPSCVSDTNGTAYSGGRYIELAEMFGNNGIGCPTVDALDATPAMRQACSGRSLDTTCSWACGDGDNCEGKCRPVVGGAELACSPCLSICEEAFEKPLIAIKTKVAELLATYCLEKSPQCLIYDCTVGQGPSARPCQTAEEFDEFSGPRSCQTETELSDTDNYVGQIRLVQSCPLTLAQGGKCDTYQAPRILGPGEWSLELEQATCRGGAQVKLANPPPAGAEITVEFLVGVDDPAGNQAPSTSAFSEQPTTVPPTLPANSAGPPPTQSPSNASSPGSAYGPPPT